MRALRGMVLLVACACGAAFAERHEDAARGYSIEVPEGWHPFTQEEMDRMQQTLLSTNDSSEYLAGFKAVDGPVQMPYLLVQWLPNRMYAVEGRQMTEEEVARVSDVTKSFVEHSAETALARKSASTETQAPDYEFNLDMERKQVQYSVEMNMNGLPICYLARMQFARDGVFQPLFFAATMDDLGEGSLARQTIESFAVTPDVAWSEAWLADTGETSVRERDRIIRGVMLGAAIVGVVWMIASAVMKKRP